jgi:hypothetical protein
MHCLRFSEDIVLLVPRTVVVLAVVKEGRVRVLLIDVAGDDVIIPAAGATGSRGAPAAGDNGQFFFFVFFFVKF